MTPIEKLDELAMTVEQNNALERVYERHVKESEHPKFKGLSYYDWLVTYTHRATYDHCIMAATPNPFSPWLGIETDGYTHS